MSGFVRVYGIAPAGGTTSVVFSTYSYPVNLSSDVTGILPVANGGTNVSSTTQISAINVSSLQGQSSSYYLSRSNHTSTQVSSTIIGLQDMATQASNAVSITGGTISVTSVAATTNVSSTTVSTATVYGTHLIGATRVSTSAVSTANVFAATSVSTAAISTNTLRAVTNVSSATVSTATVYSTDVIGATRVSTASVSTASVYAPTQVSTALALVGTNVSSATVSTATVYATDIQAATRVSTAAVSTASVYAVTQVSTAAISTNTLRAVTNVSSATVSTGTLYGSIIVSGGTANINKPSDTDYSATGANEFAFYIYNSTSGALNYTGLQLGCEANGEVYLFAVENAGNTAADFVVQQRNGGARRENLRITAAGAVTIPGHVAGTPTWVSGDKYLVVDASGNIHVSDVGPGS